MIQADPGAAPPFCPAPKAAVDDRVTPTPREDPDGFHHASARFRPVAGVHIHVPAPKALRAMVRVAATFHRDTAMAAHEIFASTAEHL